VLRKALRDFMINKKINTFFEKSKKILGFSLVELMISLITISCIAAAFTPVITKKLKKQDIALSLAQTSEIKTPCNDGGTKYTSACELCTKDYCIKCNLDTCPDGQYVDTSYCGCKNCSINKKVVPDNCEDCKKCITCTKDKCTKCETGYYLIGLNGTKHSTCQKCGKTNNKDNVCLDGINEQSPDFCLNPPSGYFCSGDKLLKCTDKYDSTCAVCNSTKCTKCGSYYYLNDKGKCAPCPFGSSCSNCDSCAGKSTCDRCDSCGGTYQINGICQSCSSTLPNCSYCNNASTCWQCNTGYYLNSSKGCTKCSISNCDRCRDGQSASSPYCNRCLSGYFVNSSGNCELCKKYDENCAACDSTKCLSCNSGYGLKNNKCEVNDNHFNCSDGNFMKIGDLCVTRKNMGDSQVLKIPDSVTKVSIGEYCYAEKDACCWQGNTSGGYCDSNGVSYSGCNRTVCNWNAANEICDKFNYLGVKWHLPTPEEYALFQYYNSGLGDNGLMLCSGAPTTTDTYCQSAAVCMGSSCHKNWCYPYVIWGSGDKSTSINSAWSSGNAFGNYGNGKANKICTYSVRCVTEMSNFK